jgi:hypothetical protein
MSKKQRRTPLTDLDAPLSPEADQFLAAATAEFNTKQEALRQKWRFDDCEEWAYDQIGGVLRLTFNDGTAFLADGQILGSYSASDSSWEWAWNNPHVDPAMARDSEAVKALGQRLGIEYLQAGMIPVPGDDFLSYLCAIGIKATDSIGVYRGSAGHIEVFITLKNPRTERSA